MESNIKIRKTKNSEIKNYVELLNSYYLNYDNFSKIDYKREIRKKNITKILGVFSDKYKSMSQLYTFLHDDKIVGFLEYTNHKVGLLTGYLKNNLINSNQIHIFKKFQGKGDSKKYLSKTLEVLPEKTIVYALIHSENTPSQRMAVSVGYNKLKQIDYFELDLINFSIKNVNNTSSNDLSIKSYKARDYKKLYELFLFNIPEEIKNIEGMQENTFKENIFDLLFENILQKISETQEKKIVIWYKDLLVGFYAVKHFSDFAELKLLADKQYIELIKPILENEIVDIEKRNMNRVKIYINSYQLNEIKLLKEIGFSLNRSYYEYYKIIK